MTYSEKILNKSVDPATQKMLECAEKLDLETA